MVRPARRSALLVRASLSLLLIPIVTGDWGDYVDSTFECPAVTTCRQVCVSRADACPIEMSCRDNQTLCADGTCADVCSDTAVSPCLYNCAPVACKKVVLALDSCNNLYSDYYSTEDTCGEQETATTTEYEREGGGFVVFYLWMITLTCAIVLWCAYNNRMRPSIANGIKPLDVDVMLMNNDVESSTTTSIGKETARPPTPPSTECNSWQIGYKIHPVGRLIHVMTVLTLVGIHGLLAWLGIQYYVNQGAVTRLHQLFQDEEQLLKVFEIIWMVGIVWTFAFKWPYSVESVFLRRCDLSQATHVAIRVAVDPPQSTNHGSHLQGTRRLLSRARRGLDRIMSFIFSDVEHTHPSKTKVVEYCRVREGEDGSRFFSFKFRRYNLDRDCGKFVSRKWEVGQTIDDILVAGLRPSGLSTLDVEARRNVVGFNGIDMVKPYFLKTVIKQISKPFYIYQSFIIWSWIPLYYYHMAILLCCVILTGAIMVSFFQYRNESNLYQIAMISGQVTVTRDGSKSTVSQEELVPGDIVHLQPGLAYCDMVLITSSATLVDESALTGEATPIAKIPLNPNDGKLTYDITGFKRQTILAGTSILECEDSRAIVLKTASFTSRGELLREIFSHKRYQMKFDSEKEIVLFILFLYAIFGFGMVIYFTNDSPVYGWFYGLYVVGTILPPLLPTVATVSVGISSERLARKRITCARADSVLVAGKVTRVFFDKTGTLTYHGLDFISTRSARAWNSYKLSTEMALAMAVCHNLTRSHCGELIGNPVDQAMFEASGAFHQGRGAVTRILVADEEMVEIVKHFDFDHNRMTQSVIVRMLDGSLIAFVKGSGESIRKICLKETFPDDYNEVLRDNAKMGIYQISFATKRIPTETDLNKVTRDDIEDSLSFLGVANFKNMLRDEAPIVVKELEEGGVKSIMVTGDNVLTGVCMAREAGIIQSGKMVLVGNLDSTGEIVWVNETEGQVLVTTKKLQQFQNVNMELAMSGDAWAALRDSDPAEAARLMENIRVFGRCTPHHKISVVSAFVEQGYVTLMCGDGGNDCGALKTAHVGIALSDAEASIVAPITSLDKTITAVTEVIKEGRCALASALASYKYMIMYGQVETINQLINAYFLITFSDWCWFFMDGLWTMTLAFSLPLARAAKKLSNTRPTASLLGPQTLSSVLGVLALNFVFTVSALAYLWNQDWYQCRKWKGQNIANILNIGDNYETEVIFLVTGFQYISSAMTYNFGYEFRQAWIRNYVFVTLAVIYTTLQFYITVNPGKLSCLFRVNCNNEDVVPSLLGTERVPIQNSFNTTVMPAEFCRGLLGIMITNALVIAGWDYFAVNGTRRYFAAKRRRESALEQ